MRIGIFDSGIGGLTVLHEAMKMMPAEEYIYFADAGNVPYGTKSKEEVKKLILNVAEFLSQKNIDALVVACNTATSVGVEELRSRYDFPVIGMEPAVKVALEKDRDKKVLVLATALTLAEEKYRNLVTLIGGDSRVESLAMPGLVSYAEDYSFDKREVLDYLRDSFAGYDFNSFGTLVLGCTHFVYFRDQIRRVLPDHIDIVDGNIGTVNHLKKVLGISNTVSGPGKTAFFASTRADSDDIDFERYMSFLRSRDI